MPSIQTLVRDPKRKHFHLVAHEVAGDVKLHQLFQEALLVLSRLRSDNTCRLEQKSISLVPAC